MAESTEEKLNNNKNIKMLKTGKTRGILLWEEE